MWSLHASLDLSCSALLGVGHFAIPPDRIVDDPAAAPDVSASWWTIPTIVVPHGIAAVPRRSPIRPKPRTPWRPSSEAQRMVERADHREWFTERVFVESRHANLPAACSTSAIVHAALVILVLLLLAARATRTDATPAKYMEVSLRMPAMLALVPSAAPPPPSRQTNARPSRTSAPAPPPGPAAATANAVAPLETPETIEAETVTLDDAPTDAPTPGAQVNGVADGEAGGVVGGTGSGSSIEAPPPPPAATGPFRVGDGIERPRKIKDVKPVYPLPAMTTQVGGSVVIEVTIGADGKVHDPRVLRSVALLDQAALDAVRQWEFEPSRLNGVPVAVTMVIIVTFALL